MANKNAPVRKRGSRRKRRRRILIIEVVILILLIIGIYIWSRIGLIHFDDIAPVATNKLDSKTSKMLEDKYTTIALFGSDNRTQGDYKEGNSDTIIVAVINNESKEVKLMSVYRDTLMDVDGKGTIYKCNSAYARGGVEGSMAMLNRNLDLNIQDYVAVDFAAMAHAVDAVGGLEIELTDQEAAVMNIAYIHYVEESIGEKPKTKNANEVTAGKHLLNGVQVVSYCRVRYTAGNDFRRAERQRYVVQLLADKMKSMDLVQANKVITSVFPDISTSLSLSQILGLASHMSDYSMGDQHGFPFAMNTGSFGKRGDCVVPCTLASNVTQMYSYLYDQSDYQPTDTVQKISKSIQSLTGMSEKSAVDQGY